MNRNNVVELDKYKQTDMPDSSIEELSDDIIKAYIDNIDMETPDLWDRIDAGFDEEKKKLSTRKLRKYTAVAAVILAAAIAIPVIVMQKRSSKDEMGMQTYDSYSDSVESEAFDDSDYMEDAEVYEDSAMSDADSVAGEYDGDESWQQYDSAETSGATNGQTGESLRVIGRLETDGDTMKLCVMEDAVYKDGDNSNIVNFSEGDRILVTNSEHVWELLTSMGYTEENVPDDEFNVYITDISMDGDGNYSAYVDGMGK
jgi:hypothetical protein